MSPNGPVCPHCGVVENIYRLESKETSKHQLRKGVYKCGGCRKQFTVTVGTIFEDSHLSLDKWLLAIHLMCSSKKGISALQLQRELWGENSDTKKPNGSYRSAWFLAHRIRWAMTQGPVTQLLKGDFKVTTNTVESFFALLKRSNYGIHHHMSRKYLAQYCAERDFVYNGRKLTDDERAQHALRATQGKRLMLKEPKGASQRNP